VEKYLLKTIIKKMAEKGTGSKEKSPILYQPLTPLISVPKKIKPKRERSERKYKIKTK